MSAIKLSRREFLRARLQAPLFAGSLPREVEPESAAGGVAHIDLRACLASAYQVCTVCVERCGTRAAIELRGALPFVTTDRCTGCGECAAACPSPAAPIRLVRAPAGGRA